MLSFTAYVTIMDSLRWCAYWRTTYATSRPTDVLTQNNAEKWGQTR